MFEDLTLRASPRMATLHSGLQARIFRESIEAGAGLLDIGEVAVAEDAGIGMGFLQATEQVQQGTFLGFSASVVGVAVLVKTSLIADTEAVLVVAFGVGTNQLFMARLIRLAVACDVVVVARESETVGMATDKSRNRKRLVTPCRAAMNHNQVNSSHSISVLSV